MESKLLLIEPNYKNKYPNYGANTENCDIYIIGNVMMMYVFKGVTWKLRSVACEEFSRTRATFKNTFNLLEYKIEKYS